MLDEERGEGVGRGMLAVAVGQNVALLPLPVVFWNYLRRSKGDSARIVANPRGPPWRNPTGLNSAGDGSKEWVSRLKSLD